MRNFSKSVQTSGIKDKVDFDKISALKAKTKLRAGSKLSGNRLLRQI
jgi:hypothetical protein